MKVYILVHIYLLNGEEQEKWIGIYSTEERARLARNRAVRLPGFCDHPEGFDILEATVDEDWWDTGFITVRWQEEQ
jgi:hypothetical protein